MSDNPFVGDLTKYNSVRNLANERRQRELATQYGKAEGFIQEDYDPTVLQALFSSDFWRRDITPRLQAMWAAASDKEFWTEDMVRSAKQEGPTAAKAAVTGLAGTPADLAVLGWHTLKWAASNVGLLERGDYSWLEDMPDFSDIPLTSDWLGEKILGEDVNSLAWIAGSIATPDYSAVAKAGLWFGPLIGLGRAMETANQAGDARKAQELLRGYDEARQQVDAVMSGELKNSQLWKETGWIVGMDGELRYIMDPNQISMDFDALARQLEPAMERAKGLRFGESQASQPISLSSYFDHPEAMGVYGDDLKHLKTHFNVVYLPEGKPLGYGGVILENANGDKFQLSMSAGMNYGGGLTPARVSTRASMDVRGAPDTMYGMAANQARTREDMVALVNHEVNHWVSAVEGTARGGNSQMWRDRINAPLKKYRYEYAKMKVVDMLSRGVTEAGEVVHESHLKRALARYFPPDYSVGNTQTAEDLAKASMNNAIGEGRNMFIREREAAIAAGGDGTEGVQQLLKTQKHNLKIWEEEVTNVLATYSGKIPSRQLVMDFVDIADPELIKTMSFNMYHRMYDEGLSRLAEEFYELRKELTPDQMAKMLDDEYMVKSVMRDAITDDPSLANIGLYSSEEPIFHAQGIWRSGDDRMLLGGEDLATTQTTRRGEAFLPPETKIEGREPGLAMDDAVYLEDVQNKPTDEEAIRALLSDTEGELDFIDIDEETGVVGLGDLTRE